MIDEYVTFFTGHHEWSAVSITTGQTGSGYSPQNAIDNAIKATDQLVELVRERRLVDPIKPAPGLISKIARIARPLADEDYDCGTVYRFTRTIEDFGPN